MHFGKPLMELEINGQKAALMIDNGVLWDHVWLFGSPLVEALQLKPLDESKIEGSGGDDPTVYFGDEKTSRIHLDNLGVIGLPLFMKFNIIFDYFNNKLYLEPNKNYEVSFE